MHHSQSCARTSGDRSPLLHHLLVHVKGVIVVPETLDQIGSILHARGRFGHEDLPLSLFNMDGKPALSAFHLKIYSDVLIEVFGQGASRSSKCEHHRWL